MVTISRWLPKTYKSNGLFQKKSRQVTSGVGCWGYRFSRDIKERTCGNSRGQLKKKLKFQGCSWKTHVGKFHASLVFDLGISMRLWFLTLEFPPRSVTQFCRICRGESLLSKGKVIEFFSEKYIYLQPPCLEFFWNSPILIKEARSAFHVPLQAIKIRITYLHLGHMYFDFTLSSISEICKLGNVTYFGEFYNIQIRQKFVA